MARPGFVLEVDDSTPPLLVPDGDRFRLEKFPLGTRVIYPVESLPRVPDLTEAIDAALDAPIESAPLPARLQPSMKLTIAFDDIGTPTPKMQRPDIRGKAIEAVLSRAAICGVDDVALVSANGLNRRMTADELAATRKTPGSLDEALDALDGDHAFLLRGDVFTEDLIRTWIAYKRENEIDPVQLRPHPHEFYLYYDN